MKINMSKKVELWVVLLIIWMGLIFTLLFSWRAGAYARGSERFASISKLIYSVSQFPSQVAGVILSSNGPSGLFIDNRWPERVGFKDSINATIPQAVQDDDGYLLISSTSPKTEEPIVKLLRISDQKILSTWQLEKELIDEVSLAVRKEKSNHYRFYHPALMPDGSIIFDPPKTTLLKINRYSEVVWKADVISHHSVEMDSKGNIWHCSYNTENIYTDKYLAVMKPNNVEEKDYYRDDAISCVNQEGEEIFRKSITTILIENGYMSLVFGVSLEHDGIHVNDIQPALFSSEYWEEGDLFISIRHKSTVFQYRPSTDEVIWLKMGPWLNQHDVDFIDSTRIGVFGNDVYRGSRGVQGELIDKSNNQFIYNFEDNSVSTPFKNAFLKADIRTLTEGRSDVLDNGDLFVEESNYGRLLRISQDSVVWEYTEPKGEEYTSMFSWSRYYTKNQIKEALELFTKDENNEQ
jgi:hypothetical protein